MQATKIPPATTCTTTHTGDSIADYSQTRLDHIPLKLDTRLWLLHFRRCCTDRLTSPTTFLGNLIVLLVVMPAFNEEDGIVSFLEELKNSLRTFRPSFVVVNDCSSDGTLEKLNELMATGFPVQVLNNPVNLGHGPSTVLALRHAILVGADLIVSIDGDGQFLGEDVSTLISSMLAGSYDVAEGVRTSRNDPIFRRCVTLMTRVLVLAKSGKFPSDPNTPLRVYGAPILERLLSVLPDGAITPNLYFSGLCRRGSVNILEMRVASIDRRGISVVGTSWGSRHKRIPSRKFVIFCLRAMKQWVSFSINSDDVV